MKGIALLALLVLAPLAQAGPIVNGRDLAPPVEFFDASSREIGAPVYLVAPANGAAFYTGRGGAPVIGYAYPGTTELAPRSHPTATQAVGRVIPYSDSAGGSPGWDAGSFGYGDE